MEKPTGGKSIGTRRGIPWHSNNPGQYTSASRHVWYILHHQSGNIWQHLICLVRLLFQTKCYSDLHYWSYCTAVRSPVHPLSWLNFTLICLKAQFTLMHQVMQGTCIQLPCKSSMWPCIHHSMCVSNVPWSWRILTWVARMSWYTPPCSYTFPPVGFSMQLLDRGHHPYICTGFVGNHFYSIFCYIYMHLSVHLCILYTYLYISVAAV